MSSRLPFIYPQVVSFRWAVLDIQAGIAGSQGRGLLVCALAGAEFGLFLGLWWGVAPHVGEGCGWVHDAEQVVDVKVCWVLCTGLQISGCNLSLN